MTSEQSLVTRLAEFTNRVIQKEHGEKIQEVCQEGLTLAKECLEILDIMHQRQSAERSKDINMSQSKDAKAMLDFLFCWAVYPTLEEGIGPALHQRVNSRVADIVLEMRDELCEQGAAELSVKICHHLTSILLSVQAAKSPPQRCSEVAMLLQVRFRADLYAGLMQWIYSPTKNMDTLHTAPDTPSYVSTDRKALEVAFRKLFASTRTVDNYDALLPLLASKPGMPIPPWFGRCVGRYLSHVLLEKNGVSDLLVYMFDGEDEATQMQVDRLGRLLLSLPQRARSRQDYYTSVFRQLVSLVCAPTTLPKHLTNRPIHSARAAAQLTAKFLDTIPDVTIKELESGVLFPLLAELAPARGPARRTVFATEMEVEQAVMFLHRVLVQGEPSAERYSRIMTCTTSRLYLLYCFAVGSGAAIQKEVLELLVTYFRVLTEATAVTQLRDLVLNEPAVTPEFGFGENGGVEICKLNRRRTPLVAGELISQADQMDEYDLNLFLEFVKKLDNDKIAGGLVASLLMEYHTLKESTTEASAARAIKSVHLLMKLIDTLGTQIVRRPEQIVNLTLNILDEDTSRSHTPPTSAKSSSSSRVTLNDLANITASSQKTDNDDETLEESLELISVTLALLNTVVTEHGGLPDSCAQVKGPLVAVLARLQQHKSKFIAELAQSIRQMILSAQPSSQPHDQSREQYEEALRSLEDPVLPVRAYGMVTLKNMILARDPIFEDPAKVDHTLGVFIAMIQDEESFIYLNAVKGISSLADVYGSRIVQMMTEIYVDTDASMDKRLRIGEALLQTIKRCGKALGKHATEILIPLMSVLSRDNTVEMRNSALAIIGVMCETYPLSFLTHLDELIQWAVDVLKLDPAPELRRAAAGFFVFLIRGLGMDTLGQVSAQQLRPIYDTLRIAEQTDPDELTRYQARMALATLRTLMTP